MTYYITCVDERKGVIVSVGCSDGSRFTEQQVIDKINNGESFLTYNPAAIHRFAAVRVAQESNGRQFIKTAADPSLNNNLDNLPKCNS